MKEICRHVLTERLLGRSVASEVAHVAAVGGEVIERPVPLLPVEVGGGRDALLRNAERGEVFPHHHEAVSVRIRKGANDRLVDCREHRGVRADAEGNDHDDGERESGSSREQAKGEPECHYLKRAH